MIVVIDNYDSFTYNLVQFLGCLGQQIEVFRNDQIKNGVPEKLQTFIRRNASLGDRIDIRAVF